ncbi:MAG: hypothetical protein H8M99_06940 [Gloeobacteraceae cyanobacterium ES-bin-144]|nr:hypothetical protein [Verrucomicrobiales bacterium]
MKKLLLALTSAIIALVLPGCFQNETVIHLNKDGSGTVVEDTRFGGQMLAMISQMSAMGGEASKKDPVAEMFSEEKLKARATQMGEGVTYQKSESVDADGFKGMKATYQFKDINTLKLSTEDSMKSMSPPGAPPTPEANKTEPIRFTYASGTLTVKMPEPKKADVPEKPEVEGIEKPDMESPEMQAMVKQMCANMKMSCKLVIESGIGESNATYKTGNTITLMEMDMGKLLEKPETFKLLGKVDKNNPAAAMESFKGIDGLKMETQKEVSVKVQ